MFSPDGKKLAYRAQKRAGFEADKWELYVSPTDASGTWQSKPIASHAVYSSTNPSMNTAGTGTIGCSWSPTMRVLDPYARSRFELTGERSFEKFWGNGTNGSLSAINNGHAAAWTNSALDHPNNIQTYFWSTEENRDSSHSQSDVND